MSNIPVPPPIENYLASSAQQGKFFGQQPFSQGMGFKQQFQQQPLQALGSRIHSGQGLMDRNLNVPLSQQQSFQPQSQLGAYSQAPSQQFGEQFSTMPLSQQQQQFGQPWSQSQQRYPSSAAGAAAPIPPPLPSDWSSRSQQPSSWKQQQQWSQQQPLQQQQQQYPIQSGLSQQQWSQQPMQQQYQQPLQQQQWSQQQPLQQQQQYPIQSGLSQQQWSQQPIQQQFQQPYSSGMPIQSSVQPMMGATSFQQPLMGTQQQYISSTGANNRFSGSVSALPTAASALATSSALGSTTTTTSTTVLPVAQQIQVQQPVVRVVGERAMYPVQNVEVKEKDVYVPPVVNVHETHQVIPQVEKEITHVYPVKVEKEITHVHPSLVEKEIKHVHPTTTHIDETVVHPTTIKREFGQITESNVVQRQQEVVMHAPELIREQAQVYSNEVASTLPVTSAAVLPATTSTTTTILPSTTTVLPTTTTGNTVGAMIGDALTRSLSSTSSSSSSYTNVLPATTAVGATGLHQHKFHHHHPTIAPIAGPGNVPPANPGSEAILNEPGDELIVDPATGEKKRRGSLISRLLHPSSTKY